MQRLEEVRNISVDTGGWNLITDAMSRVLLPEGTAPSAHIPGIDIAGKTGSAQIVSLALRAKHTKNDDFAQNGGLLGLRRGEIRKSSSSCSLRAASTVSWRRGSPRK